MRATDIVVKRFAEKLIADIQNAIRTKKVTKYGAINATGKMADSLGYSWDGSNLKVFSSEKYFTVLETGRKPTTGGGGGGGGETLRDQIEQWIIDKPVILRDITRESLAYLIARKIHREGSLLYRQGGKSGIISDFVNDKYIKENLTDNLFLTLVEEISKEFLKKAA